MSNGFPPSRAGEQAPVQGMSTGGKEMETVRQGWGGQEGGRVVWCVGVTASAGSRARHMNSSLLTYE